MFSFSSSRASYKCHIESFAYYIGSYTWEACSLYLVGCEGVLPVALVPGWRGNG